MTTTTEFENDRIRVLRVTHAKGEAQPATPRGDRLIIYLDKGRIVRTVGGKKETIERPAGSVVWRDRSSHQVTNVGDADHRVIVVELK